MLVHPTLEKLHALKFLGMATAFTEQMKMPEAADLSFEERLGFLVDREMTDRENRRLKNRLKTAKLRESASVEDIDYRHPRGLDKAMMLKLCDCSWVRDHRNVFFTGPTGVGKTYLSCALGQKACREGYSTLYVRMPRLLNDLGTGRDDGRYSRLLDGLARVDVLVLDDWCLAPLTDEQRRDLFEILEDRHGRRSTILVSQVPIDKWHDAIGHPTLADAILDRVVHNAHKIVLKGESMRKKRGNLT
jgi:DNA replication protein DnaC